MAVSNPSTLGGDCQASEALRLLALRLRPGQDLRQSLQDFAVLHQLKAAFILSAIGSLRQAAIRFADQPESRLYTQKFEVLSLQGTLSIYGIHLHVSLADAEGKVIGGHLSRGCLIYTTAEIVVGEIPGLEFLRSPDPETGFLELEIRERQV
jgi:predicted DNA-binding protein with PD1-like motif